jgi:hypothetical protein
MQPHITAAEMLSYAEHEGFTVCDIPEGMEPVGALVIVLKRGGGKADEIEVGTITKGDIFGTGPFIIFKKSGLLLGAGFTSKGAYEAILDAAEIERQAEASDLFINMPPFTKSAADREQQLCCVEGCMEPVAFPLTP